jgi:hypothetical protein
MAISIQTLPFEAVMNVIQRGLRSLREFHRNEKGLEALQVVMIIAIAAVCLIAVKYNWDKIRDWFYDVIGQGTGDSQWKSQ